MAKTGMISIRVDDELKQRAQAVLDDMGLPLSLAIELFLKQVADKERLPFKVGEEGPSAEELKEAEKRERDFWKAFMMWHFQVWPMFDSPERAKQAEEEYGFSGCGAGTRAKAYIRGESETMRSMGEEQLAAYFDAANARHLLGEAKELVYWALDMDRTFVPRLAATYGDKLDAWRMGHLRQSAKNRGGESGGKPPVADGVIGARYFGK